ncbi:ferredoxin-NADP+ reductase [Cryptococcus wingfieldii CBS 7118]|uniref:NADPH:adrenodoxin oxidoreductase, mitochondrial n=1 Tax=Cryptococcus wingfieldii CBS 7118 TaxID=1295528 RepID=A0A1E3JRS7_9TREE|nr:ferredoxin-NADP+ reductase [Cryptococcus wingfieldii CBS 7118]ODO03579.1 ferredoxin-NADP+ reductase [Cryptococcus wingfieldii CBS 7118]
MLLPRSLLRPHLSSRLSRCLSTSSRAPLKVAIIGAGPSGFYTASRILSLLPANSPEGNGVEVHMYERLPTPYGLARYGVAPDHPEVKNCQHKFDELAPDPRFKYFGNVLISSQSSSSPSAPSPSTALSSYTYPHALRLSFQDIIPYYTTLVLTYGASLSNPLNSVPGSSSSDNPLEGIYPALALVSWYNSHPAYADLPVDLRGVKDVSVVGQGNVALDVARLLLKPVEDLAKTDLSDDVLDVLSKSSVEKVRVVGRRGPGQVAFTTKEFREILAIPGVGYPGIDPDLMDEAKENVPPGNGERMRKRLLQLMDKQQDGKKVLELDFMKGPKAFLPNPQGGRVGEVEWNINALLSTPPLAPNSPGDSPAAPSLVAKATGQTSKTPADMVVESVGYRSEPLTGPGHEWDLPFDVVKGRVQNVGGRVVDHEGVPVNGVYAAGWAARGPVGVIASTMHDAYSLSSVILDDHLSPSASASSSPSTSPSSTKPPYTPLNTSPLPGLPERIISAANEGKVVVDLDGWGRIDQAERERAKLAGSGKEREKFRRVEEMLSVLA